MASLDLRNIKATPRTRMAARLYATGAARTKAEASSMAGLHRNYLQMLTGKNGSTEVKRIISDTDQLIEDETIATTVILQKLGRKAIGRIAKKMESDNEHVALKAAIDLADRSPETSKTQKIQVESFSLDGKDVEALTRAMIEAAEVSQRFSSAKDGLVEIDTDKRADVDIPVQAQEDTIYGKEDQARRIQGSGEEG